MASESSGRSLLATAIGYAIVAIVAIWLLGAVAGIVAWLFRTIVVVALLVGLIYLYLRLKAPDEG